MTLYREITIKNVDEVEQAMRKLIYDAPLFLRDNYHGENVQLYMPDYFYKIFCDSIRSKHSFPDEITKFMGYHINHNSYDNKVVLAHKDYPLYKRDDMITYFSTP